MEKSKLAAPMPDEQTRLRDKLLRLIVENEARRHGRPETRGGEKRNGTKSS